MGVKPDAPRITIARSDGYLTFKLPSRPRPLVMQPVSATEFVLPHTDARFTFQRDGQGRVMGALFTVGDGERTLILVDLRLAEHPAAVAEKSPGRAISFIAFEATFVVESE